MIRYMEHLKLIRLAVLDEQVDELGCVLHQVNILVQISSDEFR